jgi:dTDP-4-dehydrorhamnose reductase
MGRALVTGARGMLGTDLTSLLSHRGWEVVAADLAECDLTDATATREFVRAVAPAVIINCAAYTAVDRAETECELAFRINRDAARHLAQAAAAVRAPLLHLSTDYVFDGTKEGAYTEEDAPNPLGVYGASKLAGEEAVRETLAEQWIVRTEWLYGIHGKSFPRTMLGLAQSGKTLRVIDDQYGGPTYTEHLAEALAVIIAQPHYGTYHAANSGTCTWYGLACEVFRQAGLEVEVTPIPATDYPLPARRPQNSVFDTSKLARVYGHRLPEGREGVRAFCEGIADRT